MIVSASYRTDIPAFYGAWMLNRLAAGFCRVINPYGGPDYTVDLRREALDGIVFWTRNGGPFRDGFNAIAAAGIPFVVQYTVIGYPRVLETSVTDPAKAVAEMGRIAHRHGPRVAVWRYDPILVSDLTPPDWHRANFARLAAALTGIVDEVVISFTQIYRKTRRNLDAAARAHRFAWRDPEDSEKLALVRALAPIAADHGMTMTVCSQPGYAVGGAEPARCIDAKRLSDIAGRPISAPVKGNRPECACHASRDIGAYDSCPHGCVYCYAVRNRAAARHRFRRHDPGDPYLIPRNGGIAAPEQPNHGQGARR